MSANSRYSNEPAALYRRLRVAEYLLARQMWIAEMWATDEENPWPDPHGVLWDGDSLAASIYETYEGRAKVAVDEAEEDAELVRSLGLSVRNV